ncbi:MAG: cytochrome c1 [Methylobacteriaceae bacterium]|nr:cytochrome c1 [Methylobacteriaceae bacterium]
MRLMFVRNATKLVAAAALAGALFAAAGPAAAATAGPTPPRQSWSFAGPFGTYDQGQLQRGFRIYREVCAACHSLKLVAFRNLSERGGPGFSEAQVKALAAEYQIEDGPNDSGDMFKRPGRPSDRFPSPFANENQARSANNGAVPPDFSVLAKARTYSRGFPLFLVDAAIQYQEHGVDYIVALLTGYRDPPPAGVTLLPGQYYNDYMPGHVLSMAPPIAAGQIEYTDGTPNTVEQYSRDVAAFMMWAAEPKLEERKKTGLKVMIFLLVLTSLLYYSKKRLWSRVYAHA